MGQAEVNRVAGRRACDTARSDPEPLSLVFVTVQTAPKTDSALASISAPKAQHTTSVCLQKFMTSSF